MIQITNKARGTRIGSRPPQPRSAVVRLTLLFAGVTLTLSARSTEFARTFITEEDPGTFLVHCSKALRAQNIVCIRAKDVNPSDKNRPTWRDLQTTSEFRTAVLQYGTQAVITEGKGLPIFVVAYRRKERGWQEGIFSAHLAGSWPQATDAQKRTLQESLMKLKAWPEGSDQHSELLAAHFVRENERQVVAEKARAEELAAKEAKQAEERRREEAEFEAARARIKPTCTAVTVTGFIASSVQDVEALHSSNLTNEDLEDVLARHPYSCSINQFGVAYGCRGGAYVHAKKATIKNWTPTHYVVEIPLDFRVGRRDAPAVIRRSAARCR